MRTPRQAHFRIFGHGLAMMRAIRIVGWTCGAVLTLLGLFYLPADLSGWQEAAQPWMGILSIIGPVPILLLVNLALLARFIWIDVKQLIPGILNTDNRQVRGRYPSRLCFEFDPQTGMARRLENVGVARFFIIPEATRGLIFIAFERDTGTENITVKSNDNSPLRYEVIDHSPRSLIVEVKTRLTNADI